MWTLRFGLVLFERLGLVSLVKALKLPCGRCEGQPGTC